MCKTKAMLKTAPHVLMPGARLFSEVGGIDACVRGMRAPYLQGTDSVGTEAPQMTKRDCGETWSWSVETDQGSMFSFLRSGAGR